MFTSRVGCMRSFQYRQILFHCLQFSPPFPLASSRSFLVARPTRFAIDRERSASYRGDNKGNPYPPIILSTWTGNKGKVEIVSTLIEVELLARSMCRVCVHRGFGKKLIDLILLLISRWTTNVAPFPWFAYRLRVSVAACFYSV